MKMNIVSILFFLIFANCNPPEQPYYTPTNMEQNTMQHADINPFTLEGSQPANTKNQIHFERNVSGDSISIKAVPSSSASDEIIFVKLADNYKRAHTYTDDELPIEIKDISYHSKDVIKRFEFIQVPETDTFYLSSAKFYFKDSVVTYLYNESAELLVPDQTFDLERLKTENVYAIIEHKISSEEGYVVIKQAYKDLEDDTWSSEDYAKFDETQFSYFYDLFLHWTDRSLESSDEFMP